MKLKEKISIDEFDSKRYQVRLVEPNENGKAVLTHYLHNIHNGVSKYYKDDALEVLNTMSLCLLHSNILIRISPLLSLYFCPTFTQ